MCVRTQHSSEEAFRFSGKNFPILGRSLLIFGRSLPVCGGVAPQTYFGKVFRIAASILKTRTVCTGLYLLFYTLQVVKSWWRLQGMRLHTYCSVVTLALGSTVLILIKHKQIK